MKNKADFSSLIAHHSLLITCFFCLSIFLVSRAESAFIDRGGVRPLGMGGAFVAVADDSSATVFNPAGLGQIERTEIAASYDKLYAGLGDDSLGRGYVSYIYPSQNYGALALNLDFLHTPLYKETTIAFGYGRSVGPLYLGLNTKGLFTYFKENVYTQNDPLFLDNTSSSGLALDLGMLYRRGTFSFGLAALNINQPDMALDEGTEAKVPYALQTGIALRIGNTIPTVDLVYRSKDIGDKRDINIHLGVESWLANRSIALRGGVNFYDMAVGASYVFSLREGMDAQIDYAFRYPMIMEDSISSTYGSHQLSVKVQLAGFKSYSAPTDSREGEAPAEPVPAEPEDVSQIMNKVMECKKESRYEEGINHCNEILVEHAARLLESGNLEYITQAHIQMAEMLASLEKYDEALEHFQTAVNIAPRDPQARYQLGVFYKQCGDRTGNKNWYNKAIIELEKTRMINPKFGNVSSELADLNKKR